MSRKRRACEVPLCTRKHCGHGFCRFHWRRWKRGQDLEAPFRFKRTSCSVPGCPFPHKARGYCDTHLWRMVNKGSAGRSLDPRKCRVCGDRVSGRRSHATTCSLECAELSKRMSKCRRRNPRAMFHVTTDRADSVLVARHLEARGYRRLRGKHSGNPQRYTARRQGKLYVIRWAIPPGIEEEEEIAA